MTDPAPKPAYKVIDLAPYCDPSDKDDDSDAALWRAYKNYKKQRKASLEECNRALMPKLETYGTLTSYTIYHYAFWPKDIEEVIDLWPSSGKWRVRNRGTTHGGGVASLIRYLEKKAKTNGKRCTR